jgi:uracil-DNA glycosylase family 4
MRWPEHQRAMLREMGVPAFWPQDEATSSAPASVPATSTAPLQADSAAPVLAEPRQAVAPAATTANPIAPADRAATRAPIKVAEPAPARVLTTAEAVLGPRPEGVDTMDWPALQSAVAGCQACTLCSSRTQTVFGVGHQQANWMIVGEAPGEQEDKQGEPFVGRAGQLLDRMLQAVGLTRSEAPPEQQVYIANVLKCRPPANRNPLPQEVAQCEPFLHRQMALVQPKVILAMGRFAVQTLLKSSEPIGRLRGRVHMVQGVPVVVTYHPAYLLRNPADKALAWDDLCLAREVLIQAAQSPR